MTSMLRPSYSIRIGNQEWTEQVIGIDLSLGAAPLTDSARIRFPAVAPLQADPGDDIEVTLDSGEKREKVYAGVIDFLGRGPSTTVVRSCNAGGLMARTRPAVTFERITAGNVIRGLCDEAGVEAGAIENGSSLAFYAADPARTAWEHAAQVAAWSGASVTVSSDNRVEAGVTDAAQAEFALRYGRELLDFSLDSQQPLITTFATAGESGVGDFASPDALRLSADFFSGNRPQGPGPGASWRSRPGLRTTDAAAAAAAARQRLYNSTREGGRLTAFLQPHLRPGTIIELQDLPRGLSAPPLWVRRVEHALSARGALSRIAFAQGGDSFDPLALLGSLGGALGARL